MVSKEPFHFFVWISCFRINGVTQYHQLPKLIWWAVWALFFKLTSTMLKVKVCVYLWHSKMECLLFYHGSKGCRDYFGRISFQHAWNHLKLSVVTQRNRVENYSSHQQTTADSWRTNSLTPLPFRRILLFRGKWLEAWFDGTKDVWFHYIQVISYFSQLHLASGGKGQKWKPRVIQ